MCNLKMIEQLSFAEKPLLHIENMKMMINNAQYLSTLHLPPKKASQPVKIKAKAMQINMRVIFYKNAILKDS